MRRLGLGILAALFATAAGASEDQPFKASVTAQTHATSNALDRPLALPDFYQLLRGSIAYKQDDETGSTSLAVEAQATAYRRYGIEDDRGVAIAAERRRRFGRFELRGAIAFRAASEGDDILVGDRPIGIRTGTVAMSGEAEIGVDLGGGHALVFGASNTLEDAGRTHFEDDIVAPAKIEADANRLRASLSLRRTSGKFVHGATAAVGRTAYELLGDPPVSVSSRSASARGEIRYTAGSGAALAGALGVEAFEAENGLYSGVRPIWELAAVVPIGTVAELKGAARAFFDTADTDDPLASYVRRAEVELAVPVRERVKVSAGLFGEIKDNLLLENEEHAHGAYGEIAFAASDRFAIIVRGDWRDEFATVLDTRTRTFDGFVRLAVKL